MLTHDSRRSGTTWSSTSTGMAIRRPSRDRGEGGARLAIDGARASRESRAGGPAEARPDEAPRARADRPPPGRRGRRAEVARAAAARPDRRRRAAPRGAVDEYIAVPEPLSRGGEEFLLRIRGDSMVNAGILDGDFVVIRRSEDARNGEIVAALAGDDESAERGHRQALLPGRHPDPAPARERRTRPDVPAHVQILGKVMGVFRSLMTASIHRTLDQELQALVRGTSLECLVCGEFVLRTRRVSCPECGSHLRGAGGGAVRATIDDAGRVTASLEARGKSGHQRAGRWGDPRRRKSTDSGTERRPPPAHTLRDAGGKGETVG